MELPQGQGHEKPPPAANGRGAWRGGASSSSASAATPPKVYRVEPREFRDLVQRLTGAPPPTAQLRRPQQHQHRAAVVAPVVHPQPVRAGAGGGGEQLAYGAAAPWSFSFPMAGGGVEAAAQPQHGAFL